jgi:hypothetical protein
MTDDAYGRLMKLAAMIATDAFAPARYSGQLAQDLRDAIDDAMRYRWIEEHALNVDMVADPDNLVQVWRGTTSGVERITGRTLREAVDEAMKRHNAQADRPSGTEQE